MWTYQTIGDQALQIYGLRTPSQHRPVMRHHEKSKGHTVMPNTGTVGNIAPSGLQYNLPHLKLLKNINYYRYDLNNEK